MWDSSTNQQLHKLEDHKECVWSLAFQNNFLYSASDDKSVKIWNIETFQCVKTVPQSSKALSVAVGSGYLMVGTDDCKIKVLFSLLL